MSTVTIANKSEYKVGNDYIVTCTINQQWWAYYKSSSELRETGDNESEAIGNLIKRDTVTIAKVT